MNFSEDYKAALSELFEALPYGGIKQIAEELGLTTQTVHNVKNCKSQNEAVIEAAKEIILKRKEAIATEQQELIAFVNEHVKEK